MDFRRNLLKSEEEARKKNSNGYIMGLLLINRHPIISTSETSELATGSKISLETNPMTTQDNVT